jgi:hypothetical protein
VAGWLVGGRWGWARGWLDRWLAEAWICMHVCVRLEGDGGGRWQWLVGWLEGDGGGHVAGWTGGWLRFPITIGSPRLPIYICVCVRARVCCKKHSGEILVYKGGRQGDRSAGRQKSTEGEAEHHRVKLLKNRALVKRPICSYPTSLQGPQSTLGQMIDGP